MRKIIEAILSITLLLIIIFSFIFYLNSFKKNFRENEQEDRCLQAIAGVYWNKNYVTRYISSNIVLIYANSSDETSWVFIILYNSSNSSVIKHYIEERKYLVLKTYKLYPEGFLICCIRKED